MSTLIEKDNQEFVDDINSDTDLELNKDCIYTLFKYDFKKKIELDINLQILSLTKMDSQNNEIYTCVLSDSIKKYKNFVIRKLGANDVFKPFTIIKIQSFHSTMIKTEKYPIFVVSEYKLLGSFKTIIGSPVSFSDLELANLCTNDKDKEKVNSEEANKEIKNNQILLKSTPNFPDLSKEDAKKRIQIFHEENVQDYTLPNGDKLKDLLENASPLNKLSTFTKDLTVVVRVIKISEMKSFYSNKGQGCLFTFIVLDKEGTEMQVACFNKVAEKFHTKVKNMKVYAIKGGYVKVNDKKFNNTKAEFKIVLEDKSIMEEIQDNGSIKMYALEVIKLKDILNVNIGTFVDCLGVVIEVGELIHKTTKNGSFNMRRIFIVDESLFKIELSLWKSHTNTPFKMYDVILGKNLKVGDFNGKNLATFDDTQLIVNPKDLSEADKLREMIMNYKGEYLTMNSTGQKLNVLSQNCEVKRINEVSSSLNKFIHNASQGGEETMVNIKATVFNLFMTDKYVYPGCPDNNCKKKLTESIQSKGYFCSLCNVLYENPAYYYNISIIIKDCSGEFWVDVFGSLGDKLFGMSADDYKKLLQSGNDEKLKNLQNRINYKTFIFQIKPKVTFFNNSLKKKLQIMNIEKLNYKTEINRMLQDI